MTFTTPRIVAAVIAAGLCLTAVVGAQQQHDRSVEDRNKKTALAFLQEFFGDHDLTAAERYLDPGYIQHNPLFADGRNALVDGVKGLLANAPKSKTDVRRTAAEGDLVWVHQRVQFGPGHASAVVDIFRFNREGKIVEHWDVIQEVPDKSANPHPLF